MKEGKGSQKIGLIEYKDVTPTQLLGLCVWEQPQAPLLNDTIDFSTVAGHRGDRGRAGNQSSDAQHSMQPGAEEAQGQGHWGQNQDENSIQ